MTVVPFNPPVRLLTGELDEKRAIERARALWELSGVDKEDHRKRLQEELAVGLREGHLDLAIYAVRLANDGDDICDAALRIVFAEMVAGMIPPERRGPGHLQVRAYGQNAVLLPQRKRPRGRRFTDLLVRDFHICLIIGVVCREFGVYPTRNRTERRADRAGANRAPSGCSIVTAVVGGRYNITEGQVQENIWGNPMMKRLRAHGIIGNP